MKKYDLTFNDAIAEMMENNAWIKGSDFRDGIYLKMNASGDMVMVNANKFSTESVHTLSRGLYLQKYRLITVATVAELSK
jgi:hypothetical protein